MLQAAVSAVQAVAAAPDPEANGALAAVAHRYAVAITPHLEALIDPTDPADPIARQFLPSAEELAHDPSDLPDPVGDEALSPIKGIVHRYEDRVLLKLLHACPVYCRFCFRREQVGPGGAALNARELAAALSYIAARPAIWEVILTGGDPLLLSPRRLALVLEGLEAIPHVAVVRLHTRVPVADPALVTEALVAALGRPTRLAVWVAVHANHPRELGPPVGAALARLARAGLPLLGQTVLLKGVNDDAATLEALFRALVANRVKPYYLHHPDRAPGMAHFRTGIEEGQALLRRLRGRVSGLCQPTYVLDIPGGAGKVPVGPSYLEGENGVRDPSGTLHRLGAGAAAD